jgi:hypothetical protein
MKCKWRGYETDLISVPHKRIKGMGLTAQVCPVCGCDSYMHMTEREVAAWKRASAEQGQTKGSANTLNGGGHA